MVGKWIYMLIVDGFWIVGPTSMISANLFSILSSRGSWQPSLCAPLPMLWHNFLFLCNIKFEVEIYGFLVLFHPPSPPVPLLSFVTNKDGRRTSFNKISFRTWKEDDPGSSLNLKAKSFQALLSHSMKTQRDMAKICVDEDLDVVSLIFLFCLKIQR